MNRKTGKKSAIIFAAAMLLGAVFFYTPARAEQAPNFTLPTTNGTPITLSQFQGKQPVLLEFFATWCHFCQAIHPKVVALRKAIPESQLAILAIDVGSGDSLDKVKRFEKDSPSPFPVLYDDGSKVTRTYGIEGIPHIVLIDKQGTIKYQGSELPSDPLSLVK